MSGLENTIAVAYHKLTEIAQHRGQLYWIFSMGFTNPTLEFIDNIQSGALVGELQKSLDALMLTDLHYGAALLNLAGLAAQSRYDDSRAFLTQLRVEYMRLFIAPRDPVTPIYEALHRDNTNGDEKPLLFVSSTAVAVEKIYHAAGVQMAKHDSPDHLVTELEYLAYLCSKEADAWKADNNTMGKKWRRMEQEFLDEHLGKWAIKLCRQVMEQSTEPFYRDFAALAATFLHMEAGAFQPK